MGRQIWLAAALALCVACESKQDKPAEQPAEPSPLARASAAAEQAKAQAEAVAKQAIAEAQAAKDRLGKLDGELGDLDARMKAALDAVAKATTEAKRSAAKSVVEGLNKEHADLLARIAEAKAALAKAERTKGVHVSKECIDNPLAKGCQ